MYQPASTPTIRTDPAKFARNRIGRARIKPAIRQIQFRPNRVLLPGCSGYFYLALPDELGNDDSSPGWTWVFEVRPVNSVHPLKHCAIGEVDLHAYNIVWRHLPCLEDSADVVQGLSRFSPRSRRGSYR